jgi:imidazolonepropionase-like amidohydrolase
MASSSVAPHAALFRGSSSAGAATSHGDDSLALTFFSHSSSEKSHSGARGASYAPVAAAAEGSASAEAFLREAVESGLFLLGVLGAAAFLEAAVPEHLLFLSTAALPPTGKAGFVAAASPENFLNRRRHCSNEVAVPSDGSTFSEPGVGAGITRLLAADRDATAANGRRALGLLAATAGVAIVSLRSQQQRSTINADGG